MEGYVDRGAICRDRGPKLLVLDDVQRCLFANYPDSGILLALTAASSPETVASGDPSRSGSGTIQRHTGCTR